MGINTVVLGPGDIDQAHQPDEFLGEARIKPTLELLRELIQRFCVNPPRQTGEASCIQVSCYPGFDGAAGIRFSSYCFLRRQWQ